MAEEENTQLMSPPAVSEVRRRSSSGARAGHWQRASDT